MPSDPKNQPFKPAAVKPIKPTGWWRDERPGPGAVHAGQYTPVLKIGQGATPKGERSVPNFEPPPKTRSTV